MTQERKHKLNVFLIKEGYSSYEEFIEMVGVQSVSLTLAEEIEGFLLFSGGYPTPPSWASIFNGIEAFDKANIVNQHSKAILVFKNMERWFCFTFGYARHLLRPGTYERNFGLKVALNLSDPTGLRSIDKINISYNPLQSRAQTSKEAEIQSFSFNNDIDLLKSITGKITKEDESVDLISGRDSVLLSEKIEITSFTQIADRLYEAYLKKDYLEYYPWFDQIIQERDVVQIERLDQAVLNLIKENNSEDVWLAIPEIISWENQKGFSYKRYRKTNNPHKPGPVVVTDLNLEAWAQNINLNTLTIKTLKNNHIFSIGLDDSIIQATSVYSCLNAEIELDGKTYILNDTDWYNIDSDFVSEMNSFYDSIKESDVELPAYEGKTEPAYIDYVADNDPYFFKMDRKNIQLGGGRNKFEFCDLYSKEKHIIHIKKYAGSSPLSHLFNQALVSAQSFLFGEDAVRTQVNDFLGDDFKLEECPNKPDPKNYEICIAIMSKADGVLKIPFFSKVSFKHAVTVITNLGYNVTKLKIPFNG